jgi:hypothetical protein
MSDIEASQRDVPLFEVVEHIAGDLGQVVLQYEKLDHTEIGWPAAVDFGGGLGLAPVGNWEAPLPVDGAIVQAWDRALADLIGAVFRAELRAKGRGPGSLFLEAISPGDFAEVADNPLADLDSTIGYEGKRVLEFKDTEATIVKSQPIGPPKVMWTDVCAESGAEILKLWPAQPLAMTDLVKPAHQALRGRKRRISQEYIDEVVFELIEHHGNLSNDDPKWQTQGQLEVATREKLEKKFGKKSVPGESTLRSYVVISYGKWKEKKFEFTKKLRGR